MRKLLLVAMWVTIFLWATVKTGHAAENITVDELEAQLAAEHGRPDGAIAHHLSSLELTERLSTVRLQRLESEVPGEKSRQELIVLADFSAFLLPPPNENPDLAPPAHAVASQIAGKAVQYLLHVIPALPNYMATRVTNRFTDTLSVPVQNDRLFPEHPLRWTSISNETVTIRDGKEFVEEANPGKKKRRESTSSSLASEGEFGTVLIGLLTDAFHGKMSWSHWEAQDSKAVAVFRFSVLQKDSHFVVFERTHGQLQPIYPAYHGEITVDPDQGTILRLTMQGEWKPGDFNLRSDVIVEFTPVDIGGKIYHCPSRSIVVSVLHPALPNSASAPPKQIDSQWTQTELNDVRFSNYHRFRAEMRILAGDEAEPATPPPAAGGPVIK
jgi:hypothetical protein